MNYVSIRRNAKYSHFPLYKIVATPPSALPMDRLCARNPLGHIQAKAPELSNITSASSMSTQRVPHHTQVTGTCTLPRSRGEGKCDVNNSKSVMIKDIEKVISILPSTPLHDTIKISWSHIPRYGRPDSRTLVLYSVSVFLEGSFYCCDIQCLNVFK